MNTFRKMQFAQRWHKLSGLILAVFLPVHLYLLCRALEPDAETATTQLFAYTEGLHSGLALMLGLLVVHTGLGLRILVIEFGPQSSPARLYLGWITVVTLLAFFVTVLFAWRYLV